MRRTWIALVFLAGCAVGGATGQVVVPKARAADVQKWEHFCMQLSGFDLNEAAEVNARLRKPGLEGWELVTVSGALYCFKRPLG